MHLPKHDNSLHILDFEPHVPLWTVGEHTEFALSEGNWHEIVDTSETVVCVLKFCFYLSNSNQGTVGSIFARSEPVWGTLKDIVP
jgi:hypothetical protein